MLINGERSLAYTVLIDKIEPIEGADNIALAFVGGWPVIVKKEEFAIGDKAVFFEIDSKVPEKDERFAFLENKKYRIKTMRLSKFKVYSQGLLMPISQFPELGDIGIGEDVTERLGVEYYVAEDNVRKKGSGISYNKYKRMGSRHPWLFKQRPIRWLMKRQWGKDLLFFIFGKQKDKPKGFPSFISKTDEERVENQPWRVGDGKTYIITEKLDGTSCTYALERKSFGRYEFYVCSRNVRQFDEDQKTYHDHNIYWDMAFRYGIRDRLESYLERNPCLKWVCIQGEGVGSVQGNPLKLDKDDLYIFNFITSNDGRLDSQTGSNIIDAWGMKWVPILGIGKTQDTMEELKEYADGKSVINPNVNREGLVYRSIDGKDSFKNVSRKYLLKLKDDK